MNIQKHASRLAVLVLAATIACTKTAQPPLAVEVFTGQENGFHVNSTLISGERDAVLIDAQFTLSDGERLAEKIQASGKNLKTVFITHAHPDHYFGLEKIKARFPNAEVIAAPEVVEQMNTLGPQELAQWKPLYGDNLTGAPILPTPFGADHFMLEGRRIDLIKLEPGEVENSTAVYVPSIKTAVTGDAVFNGTHLWLAEVDSTRRQGWLRNLDKLKQLQPQVVIAGHKAPDAANTPEVLDDCVQYINDFNRVVSESHSAAEVVMKMTEKYSVRKLPIILDFAAKSAFGEMGH